MANAIYLIKCDYRLLFLLASTLIFLIPNTVYGLGNLQFIYAAILPILILFLSRIQRNKFNYSIYYLDYGWIGFIVLGFLSYFWAIDGALIWYQSFGWTAYFLLMILCRSLFLSKEVQVVFSACLIFAFVLLLLVQLGVIVLYGVGDFKTWHQMFGRNPNYTSCLLVVLYPYFLFQSGSTLFLKSTKVIGTFLTLVVFYTTTSKAIFIALIFIFLLWLRFKYSSRSKFLSSLIAIAVIALVAGLTLLATTNIFDNIFSLGISTRAYMLKASFCIFMENPLKGIGLGNWFLKAYNYGIDDIRFFGNAYYWIRYHSHNLFGRLLAELGLAGLLSFLLIFVYVIRVKLSSDRQLSHWEYASLSSVILYLLLSCFYNAPTFVLYRFSGVQFVAFASLGLLTVGQTDIGYKMSGISILFVAIITTGWFSYSAYVNHKYYKAQKSINKGELSQGLEILESIYHPIWNTAHSHEDLIPFQLAQLSNEVGAMDDSVLYFEEAISKAPFNGELLYEYSKLLIENELDLIRAELLLLRVEQFQSNRYAVNFLLAKVYYQKKEWILAQNYIEKLQGSSYQYQGEILSSLIQKNVAGIDE